MVLLIAPFFFSEVLNINSFFGRRSLKQMECQSYPYIYERYHVRNTFYARKWTNITIEIYFHLFFYYFFLFYFIYSILFSFFISLLSLIFLVLSYPVPYKKGRKGGGGGGGLAAIKKKTEYITYVGFALSSQIHFRVMDFD